jgi:predicted MFS family arabinose efflux permease
MSPLIAGTLYDRIGVQATFYYTASLFALGAVLLVTIKLKPADNDDAVVTPSH